MVECNGKRMIGICDVYSKDGECERKEVYLESESDVSEFVRMCNPRSTIEFVDIVYEDTNKSIYDDGEEE